MWANTCWGLLGLAVTFGLAVIGLPAQYEWLAPYFRMAAFGFAVSSALCFAWPLRDPFMRKQAWVVCQHPARWVKTKLEPSHVIILGLVIAVAGVIWLMRQDANGAVHSVTAAQPATSQAAISATKGLPPSEKQAIETDLTYVSRILADEGNKAAEEAKEAAFPTPPQGREWLTRVGTEKREHIQRALDLIENVDKSIFQSGGVLSTHLDTQPSIQEVVINNAELQHFRDSLTALQRQFDIVQHIRDTTSDETVNGLAYGSLRIPSEQLSKATTQYQFWLTNCQERIRKKRQELRQ
jgi:hypothetical protein